LNETPRLHRGARRCGTEIADVQDVEQESKPAKRRIAVIKAALQDAGLQFIDSVGVELLPVGIWLTVKQKRA
jgi:hypothetical protein